MKISVKKTKFEKIWQYGKLQQYMQFHAIFALKQSILEKQATQSENG